MKEIILNRLLLLVLMVGLYACKSKRQIIVPATPVITNAENAVKHTGVSVSRLSAISEANLQFSTFSAKAEASLKIGDSRNDVTLNFRIAHDQKIWISVTAIAGLEVARVLITPDSIRVINRLQGVYLQKPFSFINQYANNEVTFNHLEALLLGNTLPGTPKAEDAIVQHDLHYVINGGAGGLLYALTFNPSDKLIANKLEEELQGRSVVANYGNFGKFGSMQFPGTVSINTSAQNKPVSISLQYSAVTINQPLEFPFSAPRRYSIIR